MIIHYTKTLKNGLKVVFVPQRDIHSVAINIKGHAGSSFENMQNIGSSHALEHLVTRNLFKKGLNNIDGKLLGITSREVVTYYTKFLKTDFENVIKILPNIFDIPEYNEKEFQRLKSILKEEVRRNQSSPERILLRKYHELLFPNHRTAIINTGRLEDVDKLAKEDINKFHYDHYYPSNFVISIAGDLYKSKVFNLVKKYFDTDTKNKRFEGMKKKTLELIPNQENQEKVINILDLKQDWVKVFYSGYKASDEKAFSLEIIARLSQDYLGNLLKNKYGYTYTFVSESFSSTSYGVLSFLFSCDKKNTENVLAIIQGYLENLDNIATINIIQRTKKRLLTDRLMLLDKTSYRSSYFAEKVLFNKPDEKEFKRLYKDFKRGRKILRLTSK